MVVFREKTLKSDKKFGHIPKLTNVFTDLTSLIIPKIRKHYETQRFVRFRQTFENYTFLRPGANLFLLKSGISFALWDN